ncbi:Osmotin thaumatin-like protein [Fomitopsis schrenkii]|uniref:Osmotin thaumatin-like protein n=1 Tax=Fomitopsis schrenkii TaxID=2126942 RepID=S8FMC7_FOMSC|nr:Osmotin thaumatin-like protein [Fomitopsis schrenkii]
MISRVAVIISVFTALCSAASVQLINNCNEQIDPGFYPKVVYNDTETGGFVMQHGERDSVQLPAGWHGRIWARTGCDDEGMCQTGTCPGGIDCDGPSPAGPTLAQFNIDTDVGTTYFGPSSVDGFNVPIRIVPGMGCNVGPVECTGNPEDAGYACNETRECPSSVSYAVIFCY